MGVDYKRLEELRKKTRLSLLEKIRIIRMKCAAERDRRIINKQEHCNIGVDWSEADEYEFEVRQAKFRRFWGYKRGGRY